MTTELDESSLFLAKNEFKLFPNAVNLLPTNEINNSQNGFNVMNHVLIQNQQIM